MAENVEAWKKCLVSVLRGGVCSFKSDVLL